MSFYTHHTNQAIYSLIESADNLDSFAYLAQVLLMWYGVDGERDLPGERAAQAILDPMDRGLLGRKFAGPEPLYLHDAFAWDRERAAVYDEENSTIRIVPRNFEEEARTVAENLACDETNFSHMGHDEDCVVECDGHIEDGDTVYVTVRYFEDVCRQVLENGIIVEEDRFRRATERVYTLALQDDGEWKEVEDYYEPSYREDFYSGRRVAC